MSQQDGSNETEIMVSCHSSSDELEDILEINGDYDKQIQQLRCRQQQTKRGEQVKHEGAQSQQLRGPGQMEKDDQFEVEESEQLQMFDTYESTRQLGSDGHNRYSGSIDRCSGESFADFNQINEDEKDELTRQQDNASPFSKKEQKDDDYPFGDKVVQQKSTLKFPCEQKKEEPEKPSEIINMNRSLFTTRILKATTKKTDMNRQQSVGYLQQEELYIQQRQKMKQSNYMKNITPDVLVDGSMPKSETTVTVEVVKRDKRYFFEFNRKELEVSFELMEKVIREFYDIRILIPFFSQEIFENQEEGILHAYIVIYTKFLNDKYGETFCQIIEKIQKGNNTKVIKKIQNHQKSFMSYLSFPLLKKIKYSKAQILKKCVKQKIACIQAIKVFTDNQVKEYSTEIEKQKMDLSCLQLLLSFQKSEEYCLKELQTSTENNLWLAYRAQLKSDRDWFIKTLFPLVYI